MSIRTPAHKQTDPAKAPGVIRNVVDLQPCRSPYCECAVGKCTHDETKVERTLGDYIARKTALDNTNIKSLLQWLRMQWPETPHHRDALHREAADALEAMRKDAQRYRWLRDGNNTKGSPAMWIAQNHYGMDWDAAIDAAIAKDAK